MSILLLVVIAILVVGAFIGYKRGFVTGRKELDYTRIATTVLNEFRDGKIGKISLEVPEDVK